jgi:opacity protein-like surface antigen
MNIKSLLLGSAAALVAVTGARAADAVVIAEPEPVEYVRVCDTYGTGFYYIPGTEICIKIGGYVRYDIGFGDLFGDVSDTGDDTWHKRGRFALRVDARTETELGTLQGKAQINFDWTTGTAGTQTIVDANGDGIVQIGEVTTTTDFDARYSTGMERAWVKLGGFLIGVEDSFFTTWTGYASGVVNDGLIPYGPFTTHTIQYVWDGGNGFSVGAAVEEGSDGGFGTIIQDYAPHATIGAKWAGAVFSVAAVGGYDSVQDEFSAKGRVDITANDTFSFFIMGGWTDDDDGNGGNYYATWGGDWAIWAGTAIKFSDRLTFNAEFGYNDFGEYSVDADVNITVVPGFVVTPGVGWKHTDNGDFVDFDDDDEFGGYVRTQFTF